MNSRPPPNPQGLFCDLATDGIPQDIPALAWLLDNYQLVWTQQCLDELEELDQIAGEGGWGIPHGQAYNWRRMVQAARVALGLEKASSESVSEADDSEEAEVEVEVDEGADSEEDDETSETEEDATENDD